MSIDAKVEVKGLRDLRRALKDVAEATPADLRDGLAELSGIVAAAARERMPERSGRARASIVVRRQSAAAAIATGGSKAPYEPWLDFGGRVGPHKSTVRPFFKAGRYLYPALADNREEIGRRLDVLLADLAHKAGFDTTGDARG
jgi:hypothetical protein